LLHMFIVTQNCIDQHSSAADSHLLFLLSIYFATSSRNYLNI
jgi:hypothetical protein